MAADLDWQKVRKIFDEALRQKPEERMRFVTRACGEDETLLREVNSLLSSLADARSFMESPAIAQVVGALESKQLEAGTRLGRYEIIERIGAGGMGEVYLAQDKTLDRKVAVKILQEEYSRDEPSLHRFIREAKAASSLNHPNILVIHEIGEYGETKYIVSEYIEGKTLREVLERSPLNLPDALDILTQIAAALAAAHAANIIHRDIKPENIIVRDDGYVKILDFGLAKLVEQKNRSLVGLEDATAKQNETERGVIIGTVNYMSPEQAKGERLDARTDIFSLGVVIYEMIAGRTPFAGDSISETLVNLIKEEHRPLVCFAPDAPDELERIVSKTLRKSRDERYQTMKGLLSDLKALREGLAFDKQLERSRSPFAQNQTAGIRTARDRSIDPTGGSNYVSTRQTKRYGWPAKFLLAGLLVCTFSVGYYFFFALKPWSSPTGKKSLAVLPFINTGDDSNTEYLSDGITESIINNLSQLSDLRVMSRNSAFHFKNNQIDTKSIASQLGVETLVTGDIKQLGDKLVINVRLIDGSDDSQIWGNQYVKTSADIITAQEEIAQAVTQNLRLKLSNSEQKQIGKNNTENSKAYELYLRGRYFSFKPAESDIRKSIDFYQQAIEMDPTYALAYAGIADDYRALALNSFVPSTDAMPQSKAAAQKALAIDENLAEAHIALGWIGFLYDWDWASAETQLNRALELAPNNSEAHFAYAHLLSNSGRHPQAVAEGKRARELDPLSLVVNAIEGHYLFFAGRDDEAIASLQKTLELEPNYWLTHGVLVRVYIHQKRYPEAIAEARKARELSGGTVYTMAGLGYTLGKSGDRQQAQAILAELKSVAAKNYVPAYSFATIYMGLGNREEALRYLEKSYQERETLLSFIKIDPPWDELRGDSRFKDLLRRVGLSQ